MASMGPELPPPLVPWTPDVAVRRSFVDRMFRRLVGFAAGLAFLLGSGTLLLLGLAMTPNGGQEVVLIVLKAVVAAGWLAILWWLVVQESRYRLRVVIAPVAGFVSVWVLLHAFGAVGYLNIGY